MEKATSCINGDDRPVFSKNMCRPCYNSDLTARKNAGEVITRGPERKASQEFLCRRCGDPVLVHGKRLEAAQQGRAIYCSHGCRSVDTKVELPCTGCGEKVVRYKSVLALTASPTQPRVFCETCLDNGVANRKPRGGSTKPCVVCGTPTYRGPSFDSANPRYCSQPCRSESLRGERVERIERPCETCGEVMRLTPDQRRHDIRTHYGECTAAKRRRKPGERYIDPKGYAWITTPDGRNMLEHIFVMEQHLGRKSLPGENVHHKLPGKAGKSCNDLKDLELWTRHQPTGQRIEDVVAYCREMLGAYGTPDERGRYADVALRPDTSGSGEES